MRAFDKSPLGVAPADRLVGRWQGVAEERSDGYAGQRFVDLEIRVSGERLVVRDHDRHRPVESSESILTLLGDRRLSATLANPSGLPVHLDAVLVDDALDISLTGTGINGRESLGVSLHRVGAQGEARFAAYRRPMAAGVRQAPRTPVPMGDGLPVAALVQEGMSPDPLQQLIESVACDSGRWAGSQTEGVLVMRRGRLVFEQYFWGQSVNNPHQIASCAKSMVSVAAGVAVDHGLLDLDAPVASWFPEYHDCRWLCDGYAISVRHLLAMTAGTQSIEDRSVDLVTSQDIARTVLDTSAVSAPGARYAYDSGLPCLVAKILTRATGQSFESFIRSTVFDPLGYRNYRWTQTANDGALACGAAYFRPRDLLKLGQLMLDSGLWRGRRIVSRDWVAESTSGQTAPGDYGYGYLWHINDDTAPHIRGASGFLALGAGGQVVGVFPAAELVVVVTSASWHREPGAYTAFDLIDEFVLPSLT